MSGVAVLIDAKARWFAARKRFGNGPWVGKDPLAEAYEEALDLINYLDEEERRNGSDVGLERMRESVMEVAMHLRERTNGYGAPTSTPIETFAPKVVP